MFNIKLTQDQLDALSSVVEYVIETEADWHNERLESGENVTGDIYSLAMELYNLKWTES